MSKIVTAFVAGILLVGITAWQFAGALMINEHQNPFGVEETAARIQRNIQNTPGWTLSGLRNPTRAVQSTGGNVLPTLLVETCNTEYSRPLLKDDNTRILSILMPCTITVYKKDDGKTYIGTLNSGLMGRLFGRKVGEIMAGVAADQKSSSISIRANRLRHWLRYPPVVVVGKGGASFVC